MCRLAAEAGVSEASPYNLFGNKLGILTAMFVTFLDRLPNAGSDVPDQTLLFRQMPAATKVAAGQA